MRVPVDAGVLGRVGVAEVGRQIDGMGAQSGVGGGEQELVEQRRRGTVRGGGEDGEVAAGSAGEKRGLLLARYPAPG